MWFGRQHISRWLDVHCPTVLASWSGCFLGCLLLLCATAAAGLVAWMASSDVPAGAGSASPRGGAFVGAPPLPGSGYTSYTGSRNDDETQLPERSAPHESVPPPPGGATRHHRRLLGLAVASAMGERVF